MTSSAIVINKVGWLICLIMNYKLRAMKYDAHVRMHGLVLYINNKALLIKINFYNQVPLTNQQ